MNQGIRVAGRSGWSIERAASEVRSVLIPEAGNLEAVDGLELFNFQLEDRGRKLAGGAKVLIAVEDLPSTIEGHTQFNAKENCFYVTLSEQTYMRLERGESRGLFTLCHEIGHLALHKDTLRRLRQLPHRELMMERSKSSHPVYEDAEWQANRFASALTMPAPGLARLRNRNRLDEEEVSRLYHMSYEAAEYRIQAFKLKGEELVRAWRK